jgi:hypothetical protein
MIDSLDRARSALFHLDAAIPRDKWVPILMAAKEAGVDVETAREWSAQADSYRAADFNSTWRSIRLGGGIGAGTLFRMAIDAGWSESSAPRQPIPERTARAAEPERPMRETLDPRSLAYWQGLPPVHGDGQSYLMERKCELPPEDGDLRFDPIGRHPSGHRGPCLVALVTDILTGAPISLHRTWVNADGTKADVEPARLLLGGHRKAGGVIRLYPDEALTQGLAIAEGIESALSLARVFQPVWALIDAGNLAKLPVLCGVEALTIAVDDDDAGRRAADECAERWALEDREVTLTEVCNGA